MENKLNKGDGYMPYILRVVFLKTGKRYKFTFGDSESLIEAIKVFKESKEFDVTSYTNFTKTNI